MNQNRSEMFPAPCCICAMQNLINPKVKGGPTQYKHGIPNKWLVSVYITLLRGKKGLTVTDQFYYECVAGRVKDKKAI